MYRIRCQEVWGGIKNSDEDVCTSALSASLYSTSMKGNEGGDIYYFSVCGADLLTRILVADVAGHGEEVSRFSSSVFDAMKAQMNTLDNEQILKTLNLELFEKGVRSLTTAAIVSVYKKDSHLYLSYAGHPPIIYGSKKLQQWIPLENNQASQETSDLPLGVVQETLYNKNKVPLEKGDKLVLYTDGILEAKNSNGELFGMNRLLECLKGTVDESTSEIKRRVLLSLKDFVQEDVRNDDYTLLVAEVFHED